MGAPKQKWTDEEEQALRAGVVKHGAGKWRTIQKDPEFNAVLASRSNIDLKDKWRNLNFSASGFSSRDKVKTLKAKDLSSGQSSGFHELAIVAVRENTGTSVSGEALKSSNDAKIHPRYGLMIMEALAALRDPNGTDVDVICKYIEQRHETPNNFRRLLTAKLRRLLAQNKVEKVSSNAYRICDSSTKTAAKAPALKQKELPNRIRTPQSTGLSTLDAYLEEPAMLAACKLADAEAKSYLASEAVKEAERVSKMAEESQSLLELAEEILERCVRGDVVTISRAA